MVDVICRRSLCIFMCFLYILDQISGPRYLRLLAPKVTWFIMGTSRLCLYWFRIALLVFLSSKMSFIKVGFILFSVLNISIERLRSLVKFIVLLPASFRIDSYEESQLSCRKWKALFCKDSTLFNHHLVLLLVGGRGVGIGFLLRNVTEIQG